jgi:hypothetical protein
MNKMAVILKRFESPDEVRQMTKGRFEIIRLGGMTIGRATYEPYVSLHFLGADRYAK